MNLLKLTTGEMALAFNDFSDSQVTQTVINKGRKRLRVALSCDDGGQWATIAEVEAGHPKYYFHYPTLVQVSPPKAVCSLSSETEPEVNRSLQLRFTDAMRE